ncbi:MAG TPA: hypothetical protein VIP30_05345 [Stenotrophomonas sp.]
MATPANGGGPPRGIQGRIAGVWAGLLLLVVLVVAAWHSGGSRLHEGDASAPWIGLPPGGTDLADWSTRQILQQLHDEAGPTATLAEECGHDPATRGETYIATLADAEGANRWHILLEVHGDEVAARASAPAAATVVRQLRREQLAEVRDAWRVHSLWAEAPGGPQVAPGDSSPTRLEACIDGRYAIRQPPASEMSARLHAALVRGLSLPAAGTSPR